MYDEWGPDMDDHCANAVAIHSTKYCEHDLRVKDWLDSMWSEWESDPPAWFNDVFLLSLPPERVPATCAPSAART